MEPRVPKRNLRLRSLTADARTRVAITLADPAEFQLNPVGTARFTSSCDIAKSALVNRSVNYRDEAAGRAIAVAAMSVVVAFIFLPETKDRDIASLWRLSPTLSIDSFEDFG